MQEKQRQIEALTRELSAKTEQVRQFDAKLRVAAQESKKEQEKLSQRLAVATHELESTRKELADRLKQTSRAHQQLLAEHDGMKKELSAQLEAQTQRVEELSAQLEREKVEHKRAFDQHVAQVSRAEKQIAHATQEAKVRATEVERKLHQANEQVAHRAKKIQELEAAVENLHGVKARLERDSHARVAAAESKASEMAAKLSAALRERKELDARHLKEMEDLAGKHKHELERRDAVRMQEVARMQQSVQEKSKALKVVELELARYRTKGPTNPVPGKPIPSAARSPGLPGSAAPARTPAGTKSPIGPLDPGDSHGSPASSPRASAPRPLAGSGLPKPGAPSANKSPSAEPRERNILPPPAPNSDDDWTVIVDELDK
jgi:chromosome segregation ATPase